MTALELIQKRIEVLKTQQESDTIPQNIQMYEFAIRQLERVKELIELEVK